MLTAFENEVARLMKVAGIRYQLGVRNVRLPSVQNLKQFARKAKQEKK